MKPPMTNLRVLKRSKEKLRVGDVFVMQLSSDKYLFGRVILVPPPSGQGPMPAGHLLYIYSFQSDTKQPDYSKLTRDNLLIPPVWTNHQGWTRGYYETIDHRPLTTEMLLQQHCFKRFNGDFLDETCQKLSGRSEPCGVWALQSYRMIDDRISDVVGIPGLP